jgi:hypothetical protein
VPIFPFYVCKVNKVIDIVKILPKGRACPGLTIKARCPKEFV